MGKGRGTSWEIILAQGVGDESKSEPFYGSKEEAYQWAEANCPNGWFLVSVKPKRGGRRPGAGTNVRATGGAKVVKRVSPELADRLDAIQPLLARLKDWEARSQDASPTSPRWEQCRRLLNEISELWHDQDE